MARIRTIKPEIAADVKLSRVSRDARYTFVLMITQADDAGLLPGAHRQLLGLLYPLDEDVTPAVLLGWIEELVEAGLVRWRATMDGVPVVELIGWAKHQRIDNAGRSQLAQMLAADEPDVAAIRSTFAAVRGGSRRVAAVRRLDLGPRTKDLGPTDPPLAAAGGDGATDPDRPAPPAPAPFSLGPYLDLATELRGECDPPRGRWGKLFKRLERKHGREEVLRRWGNMLEAKGEWALRAPEDLATNWPLYADATPAERTSWADDFSGDNAWLLAELRQ